MYPAPASKNVGLAVRLTEEETSKLRKRLASGGTGYSSKEGGGDGRDEGDDEGRY